MPKAVRSKAKRKGSYHHTDLRRALLAAAVELAQETDTVALTLRQVARRAGVTHAAPYHHFESKAALLSAVALEGYERLYSMQKEASERAGPDPVQRLRELGVAYVEFAIENPGHFRVMFRMDVGEWMNEPVLAENAQRGMVLVSSVVAEVVETQKLEIDVMEMTLAAWSVAHGLATLWVDGPLRRTRIFSEQGIRHIARKVIETSTARLYEVPETPSP